ncbi:MAG: MFS transporter [Pirellulaceae bacterium]|nr:MFS transporter [Pirellulaceae bacterium]
MATDVTAATDSRQTSFTSAQWQLVFLLAAINFTHILDFVIVMPLGDQLRDELHINPRQFGFIVSAYGIAAMVAGITASTVIDRFDRKSVLLLSFAGFAITTLYCGLAPNYLHLLCARCLAGICGGVVASSIMAFIGDTIPTELRGRALGVVTSSFAVASVVGLPIGLTLANAFHHFRAPFLAIAGLAVLVWFLALWRLPSLRGHIQKDNRKQPLNEFLAVVRQRNHQISFVFMLSMVLATFMIAPYIATYMEANCGLARTTLPWLYAVAGLSSLVFMNLSGWMTDRFGARPVFLFCAGTAVVMSLVITNLPMVSALTAITMTSVFITFASSRVVPAQAMMLRSADPTMRGAFMSLNTAVSHLATGIGPVVSGSIIGEEFSGGPLTHYWVVGLIAATFGLIAMTLSFKLRPAA